MKNCKECVHFHTKHIEAGTQVTSSGTKIWTAYDLNHCTLHPVWMKIENRDHYCGEFKEVK